MKHIFHSKKEKKEAQNKKNRFHQEFFNFLRLRRIDEERVKGLEENLKAKPSDGPEDVGDKVALIRNRLNNQRRVSKERWNRFAGTSGGGGRGL